jgi:monovalent cation:H+ antiporter-2, CPA2 family
MHSAHFLQDLAVVMVTAAATTLLCRQLRQPVVIGYLLAGLLIGPYTPPVSLVKNLESIHTMADLGLVFLMFYLGLEFSVPKLRKIGPTAALAAVLEVVGMFGIGYGLGQVFGWSRLDSIFLGAILCISSTIIVVKVFVDLKLTREDFAQAVFGILILEDIAAVLILSVLSGLAKGGMQATAVAGATLRIIFFVVLFLTVGLSWVPRFLGWVARFQSKEMTGIVLLGLCLSGALLASWFGFSVALGAFLMGAVAAAAADIETIEAWFEPVRDMFSAIFFVSAGMLIQPELLWQYKGAILAVTLATLAGKAACGTLGSLLAGFRLATSAKIGVSLAQIGEFSFVIASLGTRSELASGFLYPLAVSVSSLTAFCTPYLVRYSDPLVEALLKAAPPSVTRALDRYHDRLDERRGQRERTPETLIVSKYLIRLAVYGAGLVGFLAGTRALSGLAVAAAPRAPAVAGLSLWAAAGLLILPLFTLISKYANHLILLLATTGPRAVLLRHINVHVFYNVTQVVLLAALGAVFVASASPFADRAALVAGLAGLMAVAGLFLRKPVSAVAEWLEEILDEVLGLATSEPTRQAVLRVAGRESIFEDITRQVAVPEGSPAVRRTIRDLGIREKTGASIVAVYRHGKHLANPPPDMELLPDDILILLGDEDECQRAQELLA